MQAIAEPSSTFITESVFLTMNRNEVFCEDLGYIPLKGLEDKTRVFRVEPKGQGSPAEHALAAYDEVIFKPALLHNGFFRYNVCDMYLITFKTAGDALRAAAAIFRHFWDLRQDSPLRPFVPQLGLDFGQVRNIRGRLYGSTLSRVAPALAHVSSTRILVSRRFLEQLQREDPSAAAPTPLNEVSELHVNGVPPPIQYLTLMSGEAETDLDGQSGA